jgi:class 3 adenylate cyclase
VDLLRLRIKAADVIKDKFQKKTTVLLADLREFTRRTEEDSLGSAATVQRLSDILDKKVTENDGKGTQTEGDSYVACFDEPKNAVIAALSRARVRRARDVL